jgi:hypothetical protein
MAFLPVFWAIPTEILSDSKAAFVVGTINALASLAGFAGPYAFGYLRAETGSFVAGFVALTCCALANRDSDPADTTCRVAQFQICDIELTAAWQVQFRFDCLHNLLWGSSQFDR